MVVDADSRNGVALAARGDMPLRHNSRILVSEGSAVARGQGIAEVGTSGRTTGPNLHFEVRYDNHAYNPLSSLAPPGPSPIESFARNGPS